MSAIKIILQAEESAKYEHAKSVVREGMQTFVEVGAALLAIRENQWYRADGYKTFDAFCEKGYSITDRHARRLMGAAEVIRSLTETGPMGPVSVPTSERQARPLATIPADQQPSAWKAANDAAAAEGKTVTAKHVQQAVTQAQLDSGQVTRRRADDGPMFPANSVTPTPVPMAASGSSFNTGDFFAIDWHDQHFSTALYHYRDGFGNDRTGTAEVRLFPREQKPWRVMIDENVRDYRLTEESAKDLADECIRGIQSHGNNSGRKADS